MMKLPKLVLFDGFLHACQTGYNNLILLISSKSSHFFIPGVLDCEMIAHMETIPTHTTTRIDRQALAGIYEQYSPGIFRYAFRMLGDQDQAEECVAETFSRFLHIIKDRRMPDNVQAYLYRIAHNWVTDSYRRQPQFESIENESEEKHADASQNPAHLAAQNLEQERIRQAMRNLPPEQRLVIALRFLEDRSHEDVAAVLGKTVEATRALQHRAIAALRRMLIEQEN